MRIVKYAFISIVSWITVCVSPLVAQNPVLNIYGERDNSVVRLAWLPDVWPISMEGIIIKRQEAKGPWQVLTTFPVIPSSFSGKDLTNIESLASERQRLANKLDSMIANGKAKPVTQKEYLENILQDKNSLSSLAFIFALDYDLILLNGFGFVDRNLKPNIKYTYGLFPNISGVTHEQPTVSFVTSDGGKPDLDLELISSIEVIGNNRKLRLHWQFDLDEFVRKDIKGFDIYQNKENGNLVKLNENVIWITSKDNPANLSYLVDFPDDRTEFIAFPISYFGTHGEGNESPFNPAEYNQVIPPPLLKSSIESGEVILSWEIDHGYDSLLKKITILRKGTNGDFKNLGDELPNTRNFNFSIDSNSEQAQYKIVAHTKTGKEIWSNIISVNYQAPGSVPQPEDLKGELINEDDKTYIELSWNYPQFDEPVEFRIFTDGPTNGLIYDSSYPKDLSSPYRIEVYKKRGQLYHFAVKARTLDRNSSTLSNEIEVLAPSKVLPPISITNISVNANTLQLEWHFANGIVDLKGFRIFVDGQPRIFEDKLTGEMRSTVLTGLTKGRYRISIIPVTLFGLEGSPSPTKNVIIP